MANFWEEAKNVWLKKTSLPKDVSSWAIESIESSAGAISALEAACKDDSIPLESLSDIQEKVKRLRKNIKNEITAKENGLDDLSLNTANSYKLQVSIPSNLNYLMKAWAAAEGRDLSSVALQCLETGLRDMKSRGSIPKAAIKRYDVACEKRIALAEANYVWEMHGPMSIKEAY